MRKGTQKDGLQKLFAAAGRIGCPSMMFCHSDSIMGDPAREDMSLMTPLQLHVSYVDSKRRAHESYCSTYSIQSRNKYSIKIKQRIRVIIFLQYWSSAPAAASDWHTIVVFF